VLQEPVQPESFPSRFIATQYWRRRIQSEAAQRFIDFTHERCRVARRDLAQPRPLPERYRETELPLPLRQLQRHVQHLR
jgi:hypothetical protein